MSSCRYYCHSRAAGMDGLNHWIPACAGMTKGTAVRHLSGMAKGLSGWQQAHSRPCRHSSEGWNPGREAGMVKGWQVLPDGACGYRSCGHSRYAGMACLNHWIPACAGMTARGDSGLHRASSAVCSRPACGRQVPLYHGSAEFAERPASMQACP